MEYFASAGLAAFITMAVTTGFLLLNWNSHTYKIARLQEHLRASELEHERLLILHEGYQYVRNEVGLLILTPPDETEEDPMEQGEDTVAGFKQTQN